MNWLDEMLKTPDDSDIGYLIEVDLRYPDNIKKHRIFHFGVKIKLFKKTNTMIIWKKIMPKNYTKAEKLICDWTDKKIYLVHFRMFRFYAGHGMVVENFHEKNHLNKTIGWRKS